jgi:protoporphyrinogen oxidase
MTIILGAGLAGLSVSYHLGHRDCLLLEEQPHAFGHIHSQQRDGFTWDEGPHVSFTSNEYVRDLFAANVDGEYEEYAIRTVNYFRGHWIDHPAQSNLFQVPQPLRQQCLDDFLASRTDAASAAPPRNYAEWLDLAFGRTFAATFPAAYTRKYWTVEPRDLTTAWVGPRVFRPEVNEVTAGASGPLPEQTNYIKRARYPSRGGYQAFAERLTEGAEIRQNMRVNRIDLDRREVATANGETFAFTRLVNTMPLPAFIRACTSVPPAVLDAADALSCSELLLVNVTAPHPTRRAGNWFYIYDEDKLATRINCTEVLSPHNAPAGHSGVQAEVYASRFRAFPGSREELAAQVVRELVAMDFIDEAVVAAGTAHTHIVHVPWANVIFDHAREPALDTILSWLERHGLAREADDLAPSSDWTQKPPITGGSLALAGRFGQWKYFWTDDCVLRGRALGEAWRS